MDWQVLKDYGEYIVGIPLGILGLVLTYYGIRKTQSKKQLTYQVLSNYRLITVDSKYRNQFKILFKDEEVENVNLVVIKFKNTGNIPIEKRDFERPITFKIEGISNIVICEIIEQEPENIGVEISTGKSHVEISPCLLNPTDSFSIQMLVSGNKIDYAIDGRVSGIKNISEMQIISKYKSYWIGTIILCVFIIVFDMVVFGKPKYTDSLSIAVAVSLPIIYFVDRWVTKERT